MAAILIAQMLLIKAESKSTTDPQYMGVEFSQPISMAGAAVVALTGTVKDIVRKSVKEHCAAQIQGSNDLVRWTPVAATDLPTAPGSFSLSGVAVSFAWVRVRWVLKAPDDTIDKDTMWTVTAELNTNVG
jgi:hypothetical protein